MPTVLMVPGFSGSGPDHWQSIWERDNPEFRRLEQRDWDQPEPEEWSRALEKTLRELPPPVFLVAHSLGCNTVVHWAKRFPSTLVAGAFLVAPADVEAESTPEEIRSFAPVPLDPLPFPGLLLFSEDDPYISSDRARAFAKAWGSTPISMGMAGHLNTASGHGPWPEGRALLQELLAGRLGDY